MSKKFVAEFFEKYNEYLRSAHWRQKRERLFEWRGRICTAQMDGCTGAATDCHHVGGDAYKIAFDTPLFYLEPVCNSCHKKITAAFRTARQRRADFTEIWRERLKRSDTTTLP